jgi:hypothetical protein
MPKHKSDPDPEPQAQAKHGGNDAAILLLDRVADALESMDRRLGLIDQSLDNINETLKKNGSELSPQP